MKNLSPAVMLHNVSSLECSCWTISHSKSGLQWVWSEQQCSSLVFVVERCAYLSWYGMTLASRMFQMSTCPDKIQCRGRYKNTKLLLRSGQRGQRGLHGALEEFFFFFFARVWLGQNGFENGGKECGCHRDHMNPSSSVSHSVMVSCRETVIVAVFLKSLHSSGGQAPLTCQPFEPIHTSMTILKGEQWRIMCVKGNG